MSYYLKMHLTNVYNRVLIVRHIPQITHKLISLKIDVIYRKKYSSYKYLH